MQQTEILLYASGSSIGSYFLDLQENVDPIINEYSIADIRSITERNAAKSYPVKIYGTAANNIALNFLFDINSDSTYNPAKKVECTVMDNTIPTLDGSFQIVSIERDLSTDVIIYNCQIYGYGFDFIKTVGEGEVQDLNYFDVSYDYSKVKIENAWNNPFYTTTNHYAVPLIDYGYGFQYPQINSASTSYIQNTQLKPAVYVKSIWDRIFSGAGYSYSSTFLESDYFKRLCIPLQDLAKQDNKAKIELHLVLHNGASAGWFKSYRVRIMQFYNNAWYEVDSVSNSTPWAGGQDATIDYTGEFAVTVGNKFRIDVQESGGNAGSNTFLVSGATLKITYNSPLIGSMYAGGLTNPMWGFTNYMIVPFPYTSPLPFYDPYGTWNPAWNIYEHTVPAQSFAVFLPRNYKKKQFLLDIINMHGLLIDVSKDNNKKLIIEPRDQYYNLSSRIVDWTDKLDISRSIEYKLLSELQSKSLLLTYKEDKDWLNTDYKTQTKHIFGDKLISFDNDFVNQSKTTQLAFSPTPSKMLEGSQSIVIPCIYNYEQNDNSYSTIESNLRILYNGGMLASEPYIVNYSGTTNVNYSTYSYAGHLDNWSASTIDLNFDKPEFTYFKTTGITDNNLYNRYYKKQIDEISHKNSRMLIGYFNLTPADIASIRFCDTILVDNHYFYLNKIAYPNSIGFSKVELLSLEKVNGFISQGRLNNIYVKPRNGGRLNINIGSSEVSNFNFALGRLSSLGSTTQNSASFGDNNKALYGDNITLFGNNNHINGQNTFIQGNGNTANTAAYLTMINSSGNTYNNQTGHNITFIGYYNQELSGYSDSNTTYVNNLNVTGTFSLSGISVVTTGATSGITSGITNSVKRIFLGKTGSTLFFASLSGAGGTTLSSNGSIITISSSTVAGSSSSQPINPWKSGTTLNNAKLGSGTTNSVTANYSFVSGTYNTVSSTHSTIVGGFSNTIQTGCSPSLIASSIGCNINTYSLASSIISVGNSYISRGGYSVMIGGKYHQMKNTYNTSNLYGAVILGGQGHLLNYAIKGVIVGGGYNYCKYANYLTIVGGRSNACLADGATILGGNSNYVSTGGGVIVGGYLNKLLISANYGSIVGGRRNTITNFSYSSSIIAGSGNTITGSKYSAIIGGSGLTMTNQHNSVFVPKLFVKILDNAPTSATTIFRTDALGQVFKSTLSGGSGIAVTFQSGNATLTFTGSSSSGSGSYTNNGQNTFTGGTTAFQSVNISAFTGGQIISSGNSRFDNLSAITLSGTNIFSGSTNLNNIFIFSGTNVGTGARVFKQKSNNILQFRNIAAGTGINISENPNDVIIDCTVYTPPTNQVVCIDEYGGGTYEISQNEPEFMILCPTIGGTFTVYLNANPVEAEEHIIKDRGLCPTDNIIVDANGKTIEGFASFYTIKEGYRSVCFIYSECSESWWIGRDYGRFEGEGIEV